MVLKWRTNWGIPERRIDKARGKSYNKKQQFPRKDVLTMKTTMKTGAAKVTTEYRKLDREKEGPVDKGGLQQLTNTLRDLKAILDVRSELDRKEQEARIAALRAKSAVSDDDDEGTGVILMPPRLDVEEGECDLEAAAETGAVYAADGV